jgi:hypothetical protein
MQTQHNPERASLTLDATGSRVTTEIARRTPEGMTVVQRLPFLKLESGVTDAQGRRARIGWVSVDMDGDTPALVMELVYERNARVDETERELGTYKSRREPTAPYVVERASQRQITIGPCALPTLRPKRRWYFRFVDDLSAVWTELKRDFRRLMRTLRPA